MITEIGIAAGEIWMLLEEKGKCKLESLPQRLDIPREVIHMAVGWLTREGHILMNKNHKGYNLLLRNL